MYSSFLLALREGLEAALIIGIVLGAVRKINHPHINKIVWAGTISAVSLSLITGLLLNLLGASLEGEAEAIFEGVTMLLAAGVLTWMIFWMQRQARTIKEELEADVRRAAFQNSGSALFGLAFLAVLREGVELALFLTASSMAGEARTTLMGAALGLMAAVVLGWGMFTSLVRLDLRSFFQITSVLLILFAGGLVAHGVHEFNEVGWIPAVIEPVWDINPLLDENSNPGSFLKALFGYNGNPSLTEVLAYLVYFAAISIGLRRSQSVVAVTQEA